MAACTRSTSASRRKSSGSGTDERRTEKDTIPSSHRGWGDRLLFRVSRGRSRLQILCVCLSARRRRGQLRMVIERRRPLYARCHARCVTVRSAVRHAKREYMHKSISTIRYTKRRQRRDMDDEGCSRCDDDIRGVHLRMAATRDPSACEEDDD